MKKFKNVQEWLESKPTKEDLEKVMNTINSGVLRKTKKVIAEKMRELKKMNRMVDAMKAVNFPVDELILKKIKDTEKEISDLKLEIPEPIKQK